MAKQQKSQEVKPKAMRVRRPEKELLKRPSGMSKAMFRHLAKEMARELQIKLREVEARRKKN